MKRYVDWWTYEKNDNGSFVKVLMGEAIFHQFGMDFEEYETGYGGYSTAIIELPDGSVKNVPVEHIAFQVSGFIDK